MDGGGGDRWRVITTCSQDNKTIFNRIMLRFRPIAPKPVTGGSSSAAVWNPEGKNSLVSSVRTKRKYVRVKKRDEYYSKRRSKNKSSSPSDPEVREEDCDRAKEMNVFTLQLLPEKIGDLVKDASGSLSTIVDSTDKEDCVEEKKTDPKRESFSFGNKQVMDDISRCCAAAGDRTVFETVVTVESVTDACMDEVVRGGIIECTEMERMNNLEKDTCPGFISDGSSRVQWVNEAYRKMIPVRPEKEGRPGEITVRLVIKEKVLPYLKYTGAFTCWVRLQYTWQKEKYLQIVPCDVWRTSFGGFAWRLDIKAALSLSL